MRPPSAIARLGREQISLDTAISGKSHQDGGPVHVAAGRVVPQPLPGAPGFAGVGACEFEDFGGEVGGKRGSVGARGARARVRIDLPRAGSRLMGHESGCRFRQRRPARDLPRVKSLRERRCELDGGQSLVADRRISPVFVPALGMSEPIVRFGERLPGLGVRGCRDVERPRRIAVVVARKAPVRRAPGGGLAGEVGDGAGLLSVRQRGCDESGYNLRRQTNPTSSQYQRFPCQIVIP
jgi:hypothetical protein